MSDIGSRARPKCPEVQRAHVRIQARREVVKSQVRSRGAMDQEVVFGEAFGVNVCNGDRSFLGADSRELQADPISDQHFSQLVTKRIAQEAA